VKVSLSVKYLGRGEVGLGLPELGEVECGDLLRLFNLLLVAPDLALQLVNQALRTNNSVSSFRFWPPGALHATKFALPASSRDSSCPRPAGRSAPSSFSRSSSGSIHQKVLE